ncbi:MAG: S49 family peptidase [Quisquiliibacterium sp.]
MSSDQPSNPDTPEPVSYSRQASPDQSQAAVQASALQGSAGAGSGWEQGVLEKLALAAVVEQRRSRRWSIFFRLVFVGLAILFLIFGVGLWGPGSNPVGTGRHAALVEVKGVIKSDGNASADLVVESLRAAFADEQTAGVILRINSPGGSPVQAGIIHDEIRRLRGKYPKIPLHVVVEDVCASGGYYVAVAADRIYVDKASMIGSIGVLIEGFGFVGAMEKLGIERRLLAAGENKGFMDSFSPLSNEQRLLAQKMINEVHQQFIQVVRQGRKGRLREEPDTFSGLVWTGARAIELGLADALGTVGSVARTELKVDRVVDFSRRENIAERLAKRLGTSVGEAAVRYFYFAQEPMQLR